jgi:hypothetical protein
MIVVGSCSKCENLREAVGMQAQLPNTVYATFAGPIDQQSLPRIFQDFSLYNFLGAVPLELHIIITVGPCTQLLFSVISPPPILEPG